MEISNNHSQNAHFGWYSEISLFGSDIVIGASGIGGKLVFSIEEDRITGEIQASGISDGRISEPNLDNGTSPNSIYQANFTGQKVVNTLVFDRQNQVENFPIVSEAELIFTGSWQHSVFGQIDLQQDRQRVWGTYTGSGGGIIEGVAQGSRVNFYWKDAEQKEGWGFFRAILEGQMIAGLWGISFNKTKSESFIALRSKKPAFLSSSPLASLDRPPAKVLFSYLMIAGSSLLGMVRSGDINRLNPLNPYLARDLID